VDTLFFVSVETFGTDRFYLRDDDVRLMFSYDTVQLGAVEHVDHHGDDDHAEAAGSRDDAAGGGYPREIHLAQERFEDRPPPQVRKASGDVER